MTDWPPDYKDRFWANYPRRVGKLEAMRKLEAVKAHGAVSFSDMMAAVRRMARSAADLKFIKHPATWLHQGCWDDGEVPKAVQDELPFDRKPLGVRVQMDTEAWRAWQDYLRSHGQRGTPHDRNFGWYFPSARPPYE